MDLAMAAGSPAERSSSEDGQEGQPRAKPLRRPLLDRSAISATIWRGEGISAWHPGARWQAEELWHDREAKLLAVILEHIAIWQGTSLEGLPIAYLAYKSRQSVRSVIRAIDVLCKAGVLTRHKRREHESSGGGRWEVNRYEFHEARYREVLADFQQTKRRPMDWDPPKKPASEPTSSSLSLQARVAEARSAAGLPETHPEFIRLLGRAEQVERRHERVTKTEANLIARKAELAKQLAELDAELRSLSGHTVTLRDFPPEPRSVGATVAHGSPGAPMDLTEVRQMSVHELDPAPDVTCPVFLGSGSRSVGATVADESRRAPEARGAVLSPVLQELQPAPGIAPPVGLGAGACSVDATVASGSNVARGEQPDRPVFQEITAPSPSAVTLPEFLRSLSRSVHAPVSSGATVAPSPSVTLEPPRCASLASPGEDRQAEDAADDEPFELPRQPAPVASALDETTDDEEPFEVGEPTLPEAEARTLLALQDLVSSKPQEDLLSVLLRKAREGHPWCQSNADLVVARGGRMSEPQKRVLRQIREEEKTGRRAYPERATARQPIGTWRPAYERNRNRG